MPCSSPRPPADPLPRGPLGRIVALGDFVQPAVEGLPECGQGPHVGQRAAAPKASGPCPHSGNTWRPVTWPLPKSAIPLGPVTPRRETLTPRRTSGWEHSHHARERTQVDVIPP